MTSDRLTRNELTWLLAQEARSAAQKLRLGVGIKTDSDATPLPPTTTATGEEVGGVESTLDKLDVAVSMLASLHGHTTRGRRGKIDLAALMWEVAPEARVQIEMGEGTTVFGDEAELRRMLHVLLGMSGDPQTATSSPSIAIRREGDEIRIGVNLGPDTSSTSETERGWLSRMAVRHGGRLVLDGSMQTLILAADIDTHRRELESLRKELAAAQAQGEAYARELAAVFNREISSIPGPPPMPISVMPPMSSRMPVSGDGLAVLVAAMRTLGADLRGILSAIGRDIAPLRDRSGEVGDIAASVGRHVTGASEVVADLARLGACPIGELPRHADVADLLRDVVKSDQIRASRHEVRLELRSPDSVDDVIAPASLTVLLHALLDHAILASPPGSEVLITLTEDPAATTVSFEDAGPPLPPSARTGVLSRDFEAIALGRPRALSLIAAYAIAAHLRIALEIDDSSRGGTRVRLVLSRSAP